MNCSWEAEWRKHHLWNENDGRVTWGLGVLVWSEHWIISLGQLGGGWVLMVSWLIPKNDHYKGLTIYLHRLKTKQLLSDSKRIWLHLMMSLEKDIWDPLPSEKKKKGCWSSAKSNVFWEISPFADFLLPSALSSQPLHHSTWVDCPLHNTLHPRPVLYFFLSLKQNLSVLYYNLLLHYSSCKSYLC